MATCRSGRGGRLRTGGCPLGFPKQEVHESAPGPVCLSVEPVVHVNGWCSGAESEDLAGCRGAAPGSGPKQRAGPGAISPRRWARSGRQTHSSASTPGLAPTRPRRRGRCRRPPFSRGIWARMVVRGRALIAPRGRDGAGAQRHLYVLARIKDDPTIQLMPGRPDAKEGGEVAPADTTRGRTPV
jgi:hypothetical protein